jgi:protein ImuA
MGKAMVLEELRGRIRRLEGGGGGNLGVLPLEVPAIDAVLPGGGLAKACVHEVGGEWGAATAFTALLAARLSAAAQDAPAVWIVRGRDLYAAGLAAYGLTPQRLIAVRARTEAEVLWAMEEALRCRGPAAVLGETGGVDLTAGRRLQLAAEAGGGTGLLLLTGAKKAPAGGAVTRWRVTGFPGRPEGPGVGAERWRIELQRSRGGRTGEWIVERNGGGLTAVEGEAEPRRVAVNE